MKTLRVVMWSFCLPLCACGLSNALSAQEAPEVDGFQHTRHAGLFPLCTGCHEAAAGSADGVTLYPSPDGCLGCHDGVDLDRVNWLGPDPPTGHLPYDHVRHRARLEDRGEDQPDCAVCHAPSAEERWQVVPVNAAGCWTCHQTTDHYQGDGCTTCHAAVASTILNARTVAGWEAPRDHGDPGFLEGHGQGLTPRSQDVGRCATCHTRDQCLNCHVYPAVRAVQGVPPAGPNLASLTLRARYPVPVTHDRLGWMETHGRALEPATCINCHTRDDCLSCHVGTVPAELETFIPGSESRALGVELEARAPPTHETPAFVTRHGDYASGATSCATCHTPSDCVLCHVGNRGAGLAGAPLKAIGPERVQAPAAHIVPGSTTQRTPPMAPSPSDSLDRSALRGRRGFHPPAFVLEHSTDAWNGLLECSNCHDAQAFCRSCHWESGLASSGRLGPGYHDAQPLWLLRHGQSARQAMESCASCHRQRECLQCHSSTGAFRISPHGPGFDPGDVRGQARRTCYACHLGGPPGG